MSASSPAESLLQSRSDPPGYDAARRAVGEALASLPEPLRSEALAAYTIVRSETGQFASARRYLQRGWDEAEVMREHYESALRLIAGEFPPLPLSDPGGIARAALAIREVNRG